ncbi:hypothetical protein [Ketobacter sp.]
MPTSLEELWSHRWAVYDSTFNEKLERLAYRAKSDLKLNPDNKCWSNASKANEESSPLFACTAVIKGTTFRLIDDGAPGLGCFSSECQRTFILAPYQTLSDNKVIAIELYRELEREYTRNYSDEYSEACDGDFCPEEIVILDQFKQPIAVYHKQKWIPKFHLPAEKDWSSILENIEKLRAEARLESGWDNHSTSRHLCKEASGLEARMKLAQRLSRIVQ